MDLMNQVFRKYLGLFVIVFIDDILIYSRSKDDHMSHLIIVLQVLKDNQLFTELSKCEFWFRSITFLGHIISCEGVEVDPRKMDVVKSCTRLLNPTDIRSFLGFSDYYKRFLRDFHLLHLH